MQASASAAPSALEYLPTAQSTHEVSEIAATIVEYLPARQSTHASSPDPSLCFPATHCTHVLPSGPDHPAMQWHAVKEALPPSDVEPIGQAVQLDFAVAATALEYEPVLQSAHELESEDSVSVSSSGTALTLTRPNAATNQLSKVKSRKVS